MIWWFTNYNPVTSQESLIPRPTVSRYIYIYSTSTVVLSFFGGEGLVSLVLV